MFHTFLIFFEEVKAIDSFNDNIMYVFEGEGLKKKRFFSKKELATYDTACKDLKQKFGSKLAGVSIVQDDDEGQGKEEIHDVEEGGEEVDDGDKENPDVNQEKAVEPSSDVVKRKKESSSSSSSKIAKKKR
jgi:hypothetical protein